MTDIIYIDCIRNEEGVFVPSVIVFYTPNGSVKEKEYA